MHKVLAIIIALTSAIALAAAPYDSFPIAPPGYRLCDGYSARTAKALDSVSGFVAVLVGATNTAFGTDAISVAFIDYAHHTASLVPLSGFTMSNHPPGGGIALRGSDLWLTIDMTPCFGIANFNTTGAWFIQHYRVTGSPPSLLTLLDSTPVPMIGCSSINLSQVSLLSTRAGGVLTTFSMPNAFVQFPPARQLGVMYRSPAGSWSPQFPLSPLFSNDINQEDVRTTAIAHPLDGSIWDFMVEPGSDTIRALHVIESSGVYTYTLSSNFISKGNPYQNQYESPPICAVQDPYKGNVALFYGSVSIDASIGVTWSPATIVDVATSGALSGIQNSNTFVGSLMTGMAGMIESPTRRSFVYRDMLHSRPFGGFATSEGLPGTNVPLSMIVVENGVWSSPAPFIDRADLFISYIANAPGVLATTYPDYTVRLYYPTSVAPILTNTPPVVVIASPTNNATFIIGAPVTCNANAFDAQDGNLSSAIRWNDSNAGTFGLGPSATYTPTLGTHTIIAQVTDSNGALTVATVSITIVIGNPLPTHGKHHGHLPPH